MYYVYIIKSISLGIFYKGYSQNPFVRLEQHNSGETKFTSGKGPWVLVYFEKVDNKHDALIREKQLKKYNHNYINKLIEEFKFD